jgi:hypothetical protein
VEDVVNLFGVAQIVIKNKSNLNKIKNVSLKVFPAFKKQMSHSKDIQVI